MAYRKDFDKAGRGKKSESGSGKDSGQEKKSARLTKANKSFSKNKARRSELATQGKDSPRRRTDGPTGSSRPGRPASKGAGKKFAGSKTAFSKSSDRRSSGAGAGKKDFTAGKEKSFDKSRSGSGEERTKGRSSDFSDKNKTKSFDKPDFPRERKPGAKAASKFSSGRGRKSDSGDRTFEKSGPREEKTKGRSTRSGFSDRSKSKSFEKPSFSNDRKPGSKAAGKFAGTRGGRAQDESKSFDNSASEEKSKGRSSGFGDRNKTKSFNSPSFSRDKKPGAKAPGKFAKRRAEKSESEETTFDNLPFDDAPYEGETTTIRSRAGFSKESDKRGKKGAAKKGSKKTFSSSTRLNKYIANSGICSRRDADNLILEGSISVNNKVVTELGFQVQRDDVVKFNKKVIKPENKVYILLNKPKDFITTTEDPEERKTVMDLVKNACPERVFPVGRLDRNTTGLLLLTNDGELAEKLTHPSYKIRKLYQAELDKPITIEDFETISNGFELEDGPVKPDEVAVVSPDGTTIGIEIHEGRNRIVRRMFEHLGYEVVKLDRVSYAGLTKKDLARGQWRFLTEREVARLLK